jgi:protein-S-isoprenylcysteine O-methyltransferase Ste14
MNYIYTLKIVWICLFFSVMVFFYFKQRLAKIKPFNTLNQAFIKNIINGLPIILYSTIIFLMIFKIDTSMNHIWVPNIHLQIALIALNYILVLLLYKSYSDLGTSWQYNYSTNSFQNLVTTGVYQYSRNPIFIFYNLSSIIWSIVTGNIIIVTSSILIIIILHYKIIGEEKFLSKNYSNYKKYKFKVPRYI